MSVRRTFAEVLLLCQAVTVFGCGSVLYVSNYVLIFRRCCAPGVGSIAGVFSVAPLCCCHGVVPFGLGVLVKGWGLEG